jgi:hypothetical protein
MATSSLSAVGMGCQLGRSQDAFPDTTACVTRVPGWDQAQLLPRDAAPKMEDGRSKTVKL